MKVYVDELPKDDCPCNRDGRCRLLQEECCVCYFEMEKNEHCPLQSLSDYTKQVREEVCGEIRTFAYDTFKEFGCFDEVDLEHILEKMQELEQEKL